MHQVLSAYVKNRCAKITTLTLKNTINICVQGIRSKRKGYDVKWSIVQTTNNSSDLIKKLEQKQLNENKNKIVFLNKKDKDIECKLSFERISSAFDGSHLMGLYQSRMQV